MDNPNSTQLASLNSQNRGTPASPVPVWEPAPQFDSEEEFDFRQVWSVIKHRKGLIAVVALSVIAAAAFWTFRKTPIYQGKFQLLVGDPMQQASSVDNLILQQWFTADTDYDSQVEVLRSSSILEPLLPTIRKKYPDFADKDLISSDKKGGDLKIETTKDAKKILEISYQDEDPKKIQYILDLVANTYLRYSLEQRTDKVTQGIKYVREQLPAVRSKVNQYQAQLQKFRQRYNLLDPVDQAKDLSQQLIDLQDKYLDTQVQLKDANSLYALLQQQVGLNPQEAISSSYLSESPRYQSLLNQLQEIEVELAKQSAVFLPNNPTIQTLQEKRANLLPLLDREAQNVLGSRFAGSTSQAPAETSPSTLRLDLNQQLVKTTNQIQVLQIRELVLQQVIVGLKQKIEQMPGLARQYTELQRDLKVSTDTLERLLESEQKLQLESAQQNIPWQVISKPTVGKEPVSPKPVRNMALGTIAGLLLGLGVAFLADRLDPVFHSLDELKDDIKLPILGVIPLQKDLSTVEKILETSLPKLKIGGTNVFPSLTAGKKRRSSSGYDYYQSSSFHEAFRSLNTNVRLLGSEKSLHSLTITSSLPAEGKSTISTNLAKAAAAMGQRVLLVDADLRKPQIHNRFNLPNEQGLSNVLATGLNLDEAIQPAPGLENLWLLTAGEVPPDPTRLLSSERMRQLQSQLEVEGKYDLVIYDTPPMSFADSRILGGLTVGIILVARIGRTDRGALRNTIDDLKLSQVPVLGMAVNCAKRSGGSYYYYNHYYRNSQQPKESA
jgi:capsular exopolysaccharide synthesis family protein